ncbi:MAG: hypothetical protein OXC99_09635 [Chloroflexi bacterium]|nr:hypothetical protein [Chloroflexota bacterium]
MNSGLIGKIEKAKRYAQDPGRLTLLKFTVHFHGDHSDHTVTYEGGSWHCECSFFSTHNTCSHTMAIDAQLGGMIPAEFSAR